MRDFPETSFNFKQTAVKKAGEEITRALNTISDIFKNFQEDYLALLLDNESLRCQLRRTSPPDLKVISKILKESPKKSPGAPTAPITSPTILSQEGPETPGIVETTQFPAKPRQTPLKPPKKSLFPSKPNENVNPGPSTSHQTPRSSQTQRILSLSKKNPQTRINSSGKVERQTKLVLQPLNQKTDVSSLRVLDPRDLEIDETMFERFTQKPDHVDVIESSPNFDVSKRKGRLRLKSKVERSEVTSRRPQAPVDEIVLSDFEVEDLEPSLSQMEKEAVAQDGKREGKILGTGKEKEKRERMRVKSDLADNANIQDIGQTRADLDETYFPRGEVEGLDGNLAKRKLSGGEGTSKIEKDKAFEIDLDGDWDTDVSMDKWTSPPPKKMMNSFDFVPEPKETHKFAYKGPVVRGKSERAKLKGWSCRDCQVYYENMNLTEDELQKRMDQCSRHRSKFNERYQTPPGFWNPVFDDTPSTQKTVCE